MASDNQELKIKLTADTTQFLTGMKTAQTGLTGLQNTISSWTAGMIGPAGAIAAVTGLAAGLTAIIKKTADYGDELYKSSQKIGVTVEALSGLKYAADLSGVEFGNLETSLKFLNKTISESPKELKQLGIDIKDASGNLRTTEDVLLDVAEYFSKLEDGAYKTSLAIKLFGRAGIDMIPFLNAGRRGIKDATDEAARFGKVITEEAAKAAEEFNDNLQRLKELSEGAAIKLGNELIPKIDNLLKKIIEIANSKEFQTFIAGIKTIATIEAKALSFMSKIGKIAGEAGVETILGTVEPSLKPGKISYGVQFGPPAPETGVSPESEEDKKQREKAFTERMDMLEKWGNAEYEFQMKLVDTQFEHDDKIMASIKGRLEFEHEAINKRLTWEEHAIRTSEALQEKRKETAINSLAFISRSALREQKGFFELTKAADIAMATMDTYTAANKAWSQLGAFGGPVAALIVAAGLANVAKIAGTRFGGGGSGGAGASATSGAGIGSQGSVMVANQPAVPNKVEIIVHGNIVDHAAFVRELQPYFREVAIDTV